MRRSSTCTNCLSLFEYEDSQQEGIWCSNQCRAEGHYKAYIERWKQGLESGGNGIEVSNYVRRYLFDTFGSKCSQCNWGEINPTTGKCPLHVDHKDGDATNNREENLRLLCPNCHSLTPNFGILNRGKGRYKRSGRLHPKHKTAP